MWRVVHLRTALRFLKPCISSQAKLWQIRLLNKARFQLTLHLAAPQGLRPLMQNIASCSAHWLYCCGDGPVCFDMLAQTSSLAQQSGTPQTTCQTSLSLCTACCRIGNFGVHGNPLLMVTRPDLHCSMWRTQNQQESWSVIGTHSFQRRDWTS